MVPHELGHAAAARLVGLRILAIQVGSGSLLFRARLPGGGWLVLRAVLLGGSLEYALPSRPRRLAEAVAVLGGPAGNLAFFALLAAASARGWLASEVAQQLAFPQLLVAAVNLVPFRTGRGDRRVGSNGAQLLALLKLGRRSPEALLATLRHFAPDATPADLSPRSPEVLRLAARLWAGPED